MGSQLGMVSFPVQGNERGARLGVWEWEGRERSGRRAGVCDVGSTLAKISTSAWQTVRNTLSQSGKIHATKI